MTVEQVGNSLIFTPFKTFVIHVADGPQITVASRESMAISPSGRTIFVYQTDDTFNIIDLLLVTDLEIRNGKAPKSHRL